MAASSSDAADDFDLYGDIDISTQLPSHVELERSLEEAVARRQKVTKVYMAILEDRPFDLECDIDVFMGSCMLPEAVEQRIAVSLLRTLLMKTFDPHAPMEFTLDGPAERPSSRMEVAPPGLCAGPRKHAASRPCTARGSGRPR